MDRRFKDHFSGHATEYLRHRPTYPRSLFEFLAATAPRRELAWDCCTGNGQAAVALAGMFDRVVATDASFRQLELAPAHERVSYRLEPAESSSLRESSCDLVTVAQALHWLDWTTFYREARRVGRPGALFAAWTYRRMRVSREIDAVLDTFVETTVGSYWPPERAFVESSYSTLPFPFAEIEVPSFSMELEWSLARALAYLRTWSSVRGFETDRGFDPVATLEPELTAVWGEGDRRVRWPLTLRAGFVAAWS